MKHTFPFLVVLVTLVGCTKLLTPSVDGYLRRQENGYILKKIDEKKLDGPYKILERVTADKMIILRNGARCELFLRGCRGLGGQYDNIVQGSFPDDMDIHLLKSTILDLSSNRVTAVVYRPANRVYVGMPKGFDNLSYVMPQLVHLAYGNIVLNHSDTNNPLYTVFLGAEDVARKHSKGYWATHATPPSEPN